MKKESHSHELYYIKDNEEKIRTGISEDPIVASVDMLLSQAVLMRASDIHLEPSETMLRVRFRIDGTLYDQKSFSLAERSFIIARLKILASLDISERRTAQDGKVRIHIQNSLLDVRISTFPSIYGEKMVVRILDYSRNHIRLHELGFSEALCLQLKLNVQKPQGFFLVTGATGSGKTTTLYALLSLLNDTTRNIVTMEDPVEFTLDGITQSQVNYKSGFTFDVGLRSLLRQDPDVIMIGEIRDKATVQIALEAALTGHLVVSTLHTARATAALARLIEMGVEPFFLNATVSGILAQRLVRTLCAHCKKERAITDDEKRCLQERCNHVISLLYDAVGCSRCFNLGYQGREAVGEFLILNDELRSCVSQKASLGDIEACAQRGGMKTIFDDLLEKLKAGTISFEEYIKNSELV